MSHENFKVGDIVELVYSRYHTTEGRPGSECIVVGDLAERENTFEHIWEMSYVVEFSDFRRYRVLPNQIRKRRPPQDWVKLCNLISLPQSVEVTRG